MTAERSAFVNYFCFGRQWRPARVSAAKSPRHPGRAPAVPWHPDPAVIGQPNPPTVMVGRPTEVLVANPGPAEIGISPISIGVGSPGGIAHAVRLPAIAVLPDFAPASTAQCMVN